MIDTGFVFEVLYIRISHIQVKIAYSRIVFWVYGCCRGHRDFHVQNVVGTLLFVVEFYVSIKCDRNVCIFQCLMPLRIQLLHEHPLQNVLTSIDPEFALLEDFSARELFSPPVDLAGLVLEACHLESLFDKCCLTTT